MVKKNTASSYLFHDYKRSAKHAGREFTLSYDEFIVITSENCYLCGAPPAQIKKKPTNYRNNKGIIATYVYNGIDRVDNSLGYTQENSKPCCGTCNSIKSDRPLRGLALHLARMLENILEMHIGKPKKD